jgi:SAM-dependent methyltransferase
MKQEFTRNVQIYRRTVQPIENTFQEKRVLEVGSAKGYLCSLLAKLGWQVQGVDLSAYAGHFARSTFDVPVFHGSIEQYAEQVANVQFPLVLAIDVLEHVQDPEAFLENILHVLKKGGVLILDTTNGSSKKIHAQGFRWCGFNPFHIYVFTPESLCRLLEKVGFSVEKIASYDLELPNVNSGVRRRTAEGIKALLLNRYFGRWIRRCHAKLIDLSNSFLDSSSLLKQAAQEAVDVPRSDSNPFMSDLSKGDNFIVVARKL